MAKRPPGLTKLIDSLARLFVDIDSSRLVVDRAEMDPTTIAFDARAINNWTSIVTEAIRQRKLPELVAVADEMYPNVPELQNSLQDFSKWEGEQEDVPSVTLEKVVQASIRPPNFFERMRSGIFGTVVTIAAIFASVGIIARQSQRLFYGLPTPRGRSFIHDPEEWTFEGIKFAGRTLIVLIEYLTLNPFGMLAALVGAALVLYAIVRWRKNLGRVYKPEILVPLLIVLSLLKALWYDVPTLKFDNVLTTGSFDMSTFDIPPSFQGRATEIWQSVVCSRVASSDDLRVRAFCGDAKPYVHLRRLYGRFLLDLLFTVALISLGGRVISKLLLPSRELAWNLPVIWRRVAVIASGVALAIAILGVPYAYSRTTRSMKPRRVTTPEDSYFRLCVNRRDCYGYRPGADNELTRVGPEPPNAEITMDEDVLKASLDEQLSVLDPTPPNSARRFSGGQ